MRSVVSFFRALRYTEGKALNALSVLQWGKAGIKAGSFSRLRGSVLVVKYLSLNAGVMLGLLFTVGIFTLIFAAILDIFNSGPDESKNDVMNKLLALSLTCAALLVSMYFGSRSHYRSDRNGVQFSDGEPNLRSAPLRPFFVALAIGWIEASVNLISNGSNFVLFTALSALCTFVLIVFSWVAGFLDGVLARYWHPREYSPPTLTWVRVTCARLLQLLGIACMVPAGLVLFWLTTPQFSAQMILAKESLWVTSVVAFAALSFVFWLGRSIYRTGRRMVAPSADDVLFTDPREPILWLRGFNDDELELPSSVQGMHWLLSERFEQLLAGSLKQFGPVIAIGKPGERLPHLGAARMYATNEEWRDVVEELMGKALLIVAVAGTSSGLRWELRTIVKLGIIDRLILVVPPKMSQQRWESVCAEYAELSKDSWPQTKPRLLVGIVFDCNGRPTFVRSMPTKSGFIYSLQHAVYLSRCTHT